MAAAGEHLVVLVPGIGGSELTTPQRRPVWWGGRDAVAAFLLRPERLAADRALRAAGLLRTSSVLPGLWPVPGYGRLLAELGTVAHPGGRVDRGDPDDRVPGARVVGVSYDFRLGIAHAAQQLGDEIDTRLADLGWTGQPHRVIVVGHSLGGLVARYWIARGNGGLCRGLITMGTPHRGAPKALDYLVNKPLPWLPRRGARRDVLREWTSVYELAPRYPAVADLRPGTRGGALRPHELGLPALDHRLGRAWAVHQEIEAAWDTPPTDCTAFHGRRHETLLHASWDGRDLRSSTRPPHWIDGEDDSELGDGTVPTISAIPIEQTRSLRRPEDHLPDTHMGMVSSRACIARVRDLVAGVRPAPLGARGDEPSIGLDLADAHPAGEPVRLRVRLRPEGAPAANDVHLGMRYRLTGTDLPPREGVMTRASPDTWEAFFPSLPEGEHRVDVHALPRDVHRLSVSGWFFVLDPHRPPPEEIP